MEEAARSHSTESDKNVTRSLDKGLLGSLFDLSFTNFVTPKLIQLLFIALIGLSGLATLTLIGTMFDLHATAGIIAIIVAPIVFLFYVCWARIGLELIIIIFRIYDVLRRS